MSKDVANLKGFTREQFASRFRYDPGTGNLYRTFNARWGHSEDRLVTTRTAHGYIKVSFDRVAFVAHRVIWLMVYGTVPDEIDHINGDTADNRLENLRPCTHAENSRNTRLRSDNTSGIKGVTLAKKAGDPWLAKIRADGRTVHLGYHATKEQAAAAYAAAAAVYHGEFARL